MGAAQISRSSTFIAALAATLLIGMVGLLASVVFPASASAGFGLVASWGSEGNGNGQLSSPAGVATDLAGNVYVADTGNHRVQKFTNTGQFLTKWGSLGSATGQFRFPIGIATDGLNVYVGGNQSNIQKFDGNGGFLRMWGKGVQDGSSVFQICTSGCAGANIAAGSGNGELEGNVHGIATDPSENVVVADLGNSRVQKYTAGGTFAAKWGFPGTGNGQFGTGGPNYVATDAAGNVYTTDDDLRRVQKFNSTGTFLTGWGQLGTGNGEFKRGFGIAVDPAGNVYVAGGSGRVQKFSPTGMFLAKWSTRALGVATDITGDIYVTDARNHRVLRFRELVITAALAGSPKLGVMRISLGCPQVNCTLSVGGKAVVKIPNPGPKRDGAAAAKKKKKTFKLKKKPIPLAAGEQKTVRVKFKKNSKTVRKIKRLIKRKGAKANATINVRGTKPFRDVDATKLKIKKLKP